MPSQRVFSSLNFAHGWVALDLTVQTEVEDDRRVRGSDAAVKSAIQPKLSASGTVVHTMAALVSRWLAASSLKRHAHMDTGRGNSSASACRSRAAYCSA